MALAHGIEATHLHSVAGLTGARTSVVTTQPCRAPHHTVSDAGLIGGGHVPRPGEVSPAHQGVLFLGELPEFRRYVVEALRQPLDDRMMTIARESPFAPSLFRLTLPAKLRRGHSSGPASPLCGAVQIGCAAG